MTLLISDANILIDMEDGDILEQLFLLPIQFAIPDILYREEIEPCRPGLEKMGLNLLEITSEYVSYATTLPNKYGNGPSHNDYLALALAKQEGCPLLTGDKQLKNVANHEDVPTMGTIWLLRSMVEGNIIEVTEALEALKKMIKAGRRLPWIEAERIITSLNRNI